MGQGRRFDHYLVIPDLQIPFHLQDDEAAGKEGALKFLCRLRTEFQIPIENVLNVGDETDNYFGGEWKKDPDGIHSPLSELQASIDVLRQFYEAFPVMRLAESNHGTRWKRKASNAEIPSAMLREYSDVIEAPPGWKWQKYWIINECAHPFMMEHGDDYGGQMPHKQAALHNGLSTIIGHHHAIAGVEHFKTNGLKKIWGCCSGSLIDFEQYAFNYARRAKFKPVLGAVVIIDSGATPVFIPYE